VPSSSEIPVQYFKDRDIETPIVYEAEMKELLTNGQRGNFACLCLKFACSIPKHLDSDLRLSALLSTHKRHDNNVEVRQQHGSIFRLYTVNAGVRKRSAESGASHRRSLSKSSKKCASC
jgi:hypothetical protein